MPLQTVPAYSNPNTTNILNGQVINDTDVKGLVESANGVNARLGEIANNIKQEVTANITLASNEDIQVFCNASGGTFNVTLPDRATQTKPIYIKVTDTSYNGITIARAGSDVIENPNSPLTTPTATSITLKSPDQDLVLVPATTGWRIAHIGSPVVNFQAELTTGSYSVTNTSAKLYYNDEIDDKGGYYDPATTGNGGRHTPLIAGMYDYNAAAYFTSGTSSELILQLRKNGTPITQLSSPGVSGNAVIETSKHVYMNGTTDYMEVWVRSATATKTILNLSYVTWFQGKWSAFY